MKKDFEIWHDHKSNIHDNKERPFFHEREIWFISLGLNIGFEQDGKGEEFKRPVIVLKKFNNECFWGIPLTKKSKKGKYYFNFDLEGRGSNTAILSQLRFLDAKRLQYKIGHVSDKQIEDIKQKLKSLIS